MRPYNMVACRFTDTRNGGNATDISDRNRLLFAANAIDATDLTNADVTSASNTNRRTSTTPPTSTGGKKT
ncbi:unnamed protein product [Callosobruchus maculatus]|uniref:Uncharacterized protein n=1 Tax=Callosobruchus maculatus TaxID=64391 RepID=A0A653CN76_CALMS|nr:unnamed protein product [Callosobruchus maculatus]